MRRMLWQTLPENGCHDCGLVLRVTMYLIPNIPLNIKFDELSTILHQQCGYHHHDDHKAQATSDTTCMSAPLTRIG